MDWASLIAAGLAVTLAFVLVMWRLAERSRRKLRGELGAAFDSAEQLQHSFNRFVPWQLVDELADGGPLPEAAERTITVLFVDLRGFTRLCAPLSPHGTIELLNRYYAATSQAITENRGHVSKYIGDGVLGVFGALEDNPWQVDDAVHAALAIVERVRRIDVSDIDALDGTLQPSIGIHTGPAIAGITGSGDLLEYTVLGTTVNLASRVENLTRELGAGILVTEAVHAKLDPEFIATVQPPSPVKGIREPVRTYSIEGYGERSVADPSND